MIKILSSQPVWQSGSSVIRIITGCLIFRYGLELFQIGELIKFLEEAKVPFPAFSGYAAKLIELVGGAFLVLGFLTRIITPLLIAVMIGVIVITAHGSIFEGELAFLYILLFALFFFQGAGKWSIDYWLEQRRVRNG